MDFYNSMLNILIGVVSGIFSGIIVSQVFLIATDFKEQRNRVAERAGMLSWIAGALDSLSILIEDKKQPNNENINNYIINKIIDNVTLKASDIEKSFEKMIFADLEPELHEIAVKMNDFTVELANWKRFEKIKINEYSQQINKIKRELDIYNEKSKRTLFKLIFKDRIMKAIAIVVLVIIALTVIA